MAEAPTVSKKLEQIEQYHGELQTKQSVSKETFLTEITQRRAVERMFENVRQACVDVAKHIATEDYAYEGDASAEAIAILRDNGVLTSSSA